MEPQHPIPEPPSNVHGHPDYARGEGARNEKRRSKGGGGCWKAIALLLLLGVITLFGIAFSPLRGDFRRLAVEVADRLAPASEVGEPEVKFVTEEVEVIREVVREVPAEAASPSVPQPTYVPYRRIETGSLFSGIEIRSEIDALEGDLASVEREGSEGYQVAFEVRLKVPKPASTIDELSALNPELPRMFPWLGSALEQQSKVSKYFHLLYENKAKDIESKITRLERLLSPHNYYDVETVLEIGTPSGSRAVLIQSEMDVVSDGSDGDRMPQIDDYISMSANYQPFTSYGWPKTTSQPNPLLTRWQTELKEKKARFAVPGLSVDENRSLRLRIGELERGIPDLKSRSFLIAEADPFVVVSLTMLGYHESDPFGPAIGDYAVVVFGDKIYPVIVGDAGPRAKAGEASLRMAKELNAEAGVYRRPVSDLKVTYLVFPGSREKPFRAPDLVHWEKRCEALLADLGGLGDGFSLHQWEDHFSPEAPTTVPAPANAVD